MIFNTDLTFDLNKWLTLRIYKHYLFEVLNKLAKLKRIFGLGFCIDSVTFTIGYPEFSVRFDYNESTNKDIFTYKDIQKWLWH